MHGGGGEEKEAVYMDEEFPSREVGWKCLLVLDGMGCKVRSFRVEGCA